MHVITIEFTGVRYFGWICRISEWPGIPPSRAKANHMRLIDVIDASPQSHIAPAMITATKLARNGERLSLAILRTG